MIGPNLRAEIESLFTVVPERSTDDELVFICPECGDQNGNRSVNLRNGMTNCWRCDKGSSGRGLFVAWAKALGFELDGRQVYTSESLDKNLRELGGFSQASEEEGADADVSVDLPGGFTLLKDKPNSAYTTLIGEMAERKNLCLEDLIRVNAGFTKTDSYWEPYCLFPVVESKRVVYYQGRTYIDEPGQTTKRFPSRKYCPFGARYWVYGIDFVYKRKATVVIVVESILNVLSLRRKLHQEGVRDVVPVCVFKHAISEVQLMKLRRADVREVCIMFDRDATHKAWQACKSSDMKFSVAEMPEVAGQAKLDANDDVDLAYEAFLSREQATLSTKTLRGLQPEPSTFRPPDFGIPK